MGLCILDEIDNIKQKRKEVYETYKEELLGLVEQQQQNKNATQNYSYFPIILENEKQSLEVQKNLNKKQIFPRRYFYPSLNTLAYIEPKQHMPVSKDIASRILCLPIYPGLKKIEQLRIINILKGTL